MTPFNKTKQTQAGCLSSRYVYDGPNVVLDLNSSNEVVHAYVNGPSIDQPIERIAFIGGEPRTRLVYHTDGLGSVVAVTDSQQLTAKSYQYEAFGKIRSETGTLTINRYTYTAREALGDSLGLYYYRWRVMDPRVGRFTSEDPLGFVDGANLYGYVGLDPMDLIDAYGLKWWWPWGKKDPAKKPAQKKPCPAELGAKDVVSAMLDSANPSPIGLGAADAAITLGENVPKMLEHNRIQYDQWESLRPPGDTNWTNPYSDLPKAGLPYMNKKYPGYSP